MRCLSALAAAVALVAAAGCGSIISIPDQGVVVLGCAAPSACFLANCSCKRKDTMTGGSCTTPAVTPGKTTCDVLSSLTCLCPPTVNFTVPDIDMAGNFDLAPPPIVVPNVATACMEVATACVGRGPFCGGTGARCVQSDQTCSSATGDPPQLLPIGSMGDGGVMGPAFEPHCQFTDDICCPGVDAGATD